MSGRMTIFSGLNIFAVSAMKRTPQKAMTSASVAAALRDRSRLSPTKSARSWICRLLVIMGEDDRIALFLEALDLGEEIEPLEALGRGGHGEIVLKRQRCCRASSSTSL